jgi:hypothetical protein
MSLKEKESRYFRLTETTKTKTITERREKATLERQMEEIKI